MATNNALQWTMTRGARRVSGAEKYFTPSRALTVCPPPLNAGVSCHEPYCRQAITILVRYIVGNGPTGFTCYMSPPCSP